MSRSMRFKDKVAIVFHFAVFFHFVYGDFVILPLYDNIHKALGKEVNDPEILRYKSATPWFLTLWNSAVHQIYFGFCCLAHLSQAFPTSIPSLVLDITDAIRHTILTSILVPSSIMTAVNYWVMNTISPEHVYSHFIAVYPEWINHSIHTFVVPIAIFEMYLRASSGETFGIGKPKDWIMVYGYVTLYTLATAYHLARTGTWIYPFYDVMNNWMRAGVFISMYASVSLYYAYTLSWVSGLGRHHARRRMLSAFEKMKFEEKKK